MLFNRSLVFSISSLELFSYHVSVALVSINPFLNFLCFIYLASFPQNRYMNYICYLLIKANNLQADNFYPTQNVFYYEIEDTTKVKFQKDPTNCASMFQNDEFKQTIHRYRGVVMNAVKIFLILIIFNIFFALINSQSKIKFC